MVEYTTPLPFLGLSESDSKFYSNFQFCEGKNSSTFGKHIDLQNQAIYVEKCFFFQEKYTFLRDGTSSVRVDILSTYFSKCLIKMIKLH